MSKVKSLFAIGLVVVCLSGCISFGSTFGKSNNSNFMQPMAGIRNWVACFNDPMLGGLAILLVPDLPFSFALDIVLLPITAPYALIQALRPEKDKQYE